MNRCQSQRRVQYDGDVGGDGENMKIRAAERNVTEDLEPFMGVKIRWKASRHRDYLGDYVDVQSRPFLMKILHKQADKKVRFADKLMKLTGSGKMKRRILLITYFVIYVIDPETEALKRRITLAAVDKLCLSELDLSIMQLLIWLERFNLRKLRWRENEDCEKMIEVALPHTIYKLDALS